MMHYTPAQIDEMSLWEFACVMSSQETDEPDKPEPPSFADFEEAIGRIH